MRHLSVLRAATVAAVALATCLSAAAPAAAAPTKVITVDAEVVYRDGQKPDDPGNCSAVVFVQWPHVENATAWKVNWTETAAGEQSRTVTPPFDDTYEWVATYRVPSGFHWIEVGVTWADGPGTRDCKDATAKHREMYGTKASAEVTVDTTAECNEAKAAYAAAGKRLKKARASLKVAGRPAARRRAKGAILRALRDQKAAKQEMKRVC